MDFVAIDVETANPNLASICQIGVARFAEDRLVEEWSSLVDPEDYFDPMNVFIHGITDRRVKGEPRLPQVAEELRSKLQSHVCVCHTHFDRVAIGRAFQKYKIEPLAADWLDTACVARRTWKDVAQKGYGLASLCQRIGYEFGHHDALEDAKAAGHVLLAALKESQCPLSEWQRRVRQPVDPGRSSSGSAIHRDGNAEGPLFGEVMVFTGTLEIPRFEAANLAASVGCEVAPSVTRRTTILIVGDQDISRLAGQEKSSKHRRAEQLIADGSAIRIIGESDFKALVDSASPVRA